MRRVLFILVLSSFMSMQASAIEFGFGILGGVTSAEQKDLNILIDLANTRAGGISTKNLDSAWEGGLYLQWKSDFLAFQIRPTMFFQTEEGSASSGSSYPGDYEYSMSGQTIGGLFKLYPLENANMRFFFQTGVMWGMLETEIKEGSYSSVSDGSALGYQFGAGFDLFYESHVFSFEVGWRFFEVERNIVSSTSGAAEEITQTSKDDELEYNNKDLGTCMTGTQLFVSYGYRF